MSHQYWIKVATSWIWILLLSPVLSASYSSTKLQHQIDKTGNKSQFSKFLFISVVLLYCVTFSECYYIYTFAGNGLEGYSGDEGPATSAELYFPTGTAVSLTGEVYIADTGNCVIRVVYTNGTISSFAGNGSPGYSGDGGPATSAELFNPYGVAVFSRNETYICDSWNYRVRAIVNSPSSLCSNIGYYQSQSYCICLNGAINSCSSCYGVNSNSSNICSGRGTCQTPNNCLCNSGYTGYNCELISCYGVNQTASNVCSGQGTCNGPNDCICNSGYTGYECQYSICYGLNQTSSDVCSGHGKCIKFNICSCTSGFTGENCQYVSIAIKLTINFVLFSQIIAYLII
jgi:hypothetical protein